jgi:hypothetical protein
VTVHVRLRPFSEEEYVKDRQTFIETFDPDKKLIIGKSLGIVPFLYFHTVKKEYERKMFNFDSIFDPKIDQSLIYETAAKPVIEVRLNNPCEHV